MSMTRDADVIVIGAGVVGVATAYALANDGLSVLVLDRADGPATRASFANGAQLSYAYTDALASPALLRKLPGLLMARDGIFRFKPPTDIDYLAWLLKFLANCSQRQFEQNTLAGLKLGLQSRLELHKLLERHALAFEHRAPGKMLLYRDQQALADARRVAQLKQAAGIAQTELSAAAARDLEPALAGFTGLAGAMLYPEEEVGNPHLFAKALLYVLTAEYGVQARFAVDCSDFFETPHGMGIRSRAGEEFVARDIVVCGGPDSRALLRSVGVRTYVEPMKGYSVSAPLGSAAPDISITDTSRKIVFCRLGNQIRIAGLAELGERSVEIDERRISKLKSLAREALPEAAAYDQVMHSWAGLRPMSPNSLPTIARVAPRVIANVGHGMLGWTYALGSARQVANIMANKFQEHDHDERRSTAAQPISASG